MRFSVSRKRPKIIVQIFGAISARLPIRQHAIIEGPRLVDLLAYPLTQITSALVYRICYHACLNESLGANKNDMRLTHAETEPLDARSVARVCRTLKRKRVIGCKRWHEPAAHRYIGESLGGRSDTRLSHTEMPACRWFKKSHVPAAHWNVCKCTFHSRLSTNMDRS